MRCLSASEFAVVTRVTRTSYPGSFSATVANHACRYVLGSSWLTTSSAMVTKLPDGSNRYSILTCTPTGWRLPSLSVRRYSPSSQVSSMRSVVAGAVIWTVSGLP